MNRAHFALLAAPALTSACLVYEEGRPGPVNTPPDLYWGEAGCYWDDYYRDDIVYFDAEADDMDGVFDVVAVYADVYDLRNEQWVDSFELYPTEDPVYWFSDWLGSTTWVDCAYPSYVVDLVAYDSFDAFDVLTVDFYGYAH